MSQLHFYITLGVFAAVILAIAFDAIEMATAALLGVSVLIAFGILNEQDIMAAVSIAGGPLLLLFGGMVVARVLSTTGLFERVGDVYLRATRGSGKRFLLLLLVLVAPLCALLPNATTIVLLAPIIIRVAVALEVDFVGPMILAALISNSAGLLTLVGDPATFLVGSSIGMSFGYYLRHVSLGGVLALLVIVPMIPVLMPEIWHMKRDLPPMEPAKAFARPCFAACALAVLAGMVALFIFGEQLPTRVVPPTVAVIAAALALLLVYASRIEPVDKVIRDVDWKTLLFLACIFCLVQAFGKTGTLQSASIKLYEFAGKDLMLVALMLIAGVGLLSSLLANIPVVAGSLLMVKGYLVAADVVPEMALTPYFTDWPSATVPVFIGMMFGATLGGNATLIGASANVVAAGICTNNGRRVTFGRFMRYGLPITVIQLGVSALYVVALSKILR
jgi:Na+/H+ antiporter NhaD/arsenite permease-like protein